MRSKSFTFRACAAAILAGFLSIAPPFGASDAAAEDGLVVQLDRARVMNITEPVSTIIIGNPAIADASMPDQNTLVLTGKSFGETNILMLDSQGAVMGEHIIYVRGGANKSIAVYRKTSRATYSCTPKCEPAPVLGDDPDYFNSVAASINSRTSLAEGNATGDAAQ